MNLCNELGITENQIQLQSQQESLEVYDPSDPRWNPQNQCGRLSGTITIKNLVIMGHYLYGNVQTARDSATTIVADCNDFLFGKWRMVKQNSYESYDINDLKALLGYTVEYFYGIYWAASIGDWDSVKTFSEYPSADARIDTTYKKSDQAYLLLLSTFLANGDVADCQKHMEIIDNNRPKKQKFLLNLIRSITEGDSSSFNATLNNYIKYYIQREFGDGIPNMQSLDGTFFVNLGKYHHLEVDIKNDYKKYIIDFTI